jgi:pimeloyl-ACP methyl ester carboxylesterase
MKSRMVVFIHGMYMTSLCWEQWLEAFRDKGYKCMALAWPGRDRPVDVLRKAQPDPQLGKLTLSDVVNHMADTIRMLAEKPVVIGHSMGGLVLQQLLQKDLAAAGVAIDSAPPMGVFSTRWSFLKSNWPHITPFVSAGDPVQMSFKRFQYTFVHSLPEAEQRAAYDRYVVPESRRVPRESLAARIDFKKAHAPLLLVAGSDDHLIPASLNRSNWARYAQAGSVTDFKEFAGRTHFIIGQKNWQEVANYIVEWLETRAA